MCFLLAHLNLVRSDTPRILNSGKRDHLWPCRGRVGARRNVLPRFLEDHEGNIPKTAALEAEVGRHMDLLEEERQRGSDAEGRVQASLEKSTKLEAEGLQREVKMEALPRSRVLPS